MQYKAGDYTSVSPNFSAMPFRQLASRLAENRESEPRHRLPNNYFLPFDLAGGSNAPTVEAFGVMPGRYKPVS